MTLAELVRLLEQHGVSLTLMPEGKLKPTAAKPPPTEVLAGLRQHRAALARRLEEGRTIDGRLDVNRLSQQPGRCGSCAKWLPTPYALEGECIAGRRAHGWFGGDPRAEVLTHPAHQCGVLEGIGYRARTDLPAWARKVTSEVGWDDLPPLVDDGAA